MGIGNKLVGHLGEVFGHQGSEVTIFTQRQQVLLMKSVDIANTVILDDTIRDNERLALIHSSKTVHCETVRGVS